VRGWFAPRPSLLAAQLGRRTNLSGKTDNIEEASRSYPLLTLLYCSIARIFRSSSAIRSLIFRAVSPSGNSQSRCFDHRWISFRDTSRSRRGRSCMLIAMEQGTNCANAPSAIAADLQISVRILWAFTPEPWVRTQKSALPAAKDMIARAAQVSLAPIANVITKRGEAIYRTAMVIATARTTSQESAPIHPAESASHSNAPLDKRLNPDELKPTSPEERTSTLTF